MFSDVLSLHAVRPLIGTIISAAWPSSLASASALSSSSSGAPNEPPAPLRPSSAVHSAALAVFQPIELPRILLHIALTAKGTALIAAMGGLPVLVGALHALMFPALVTARHVLNQAASSTSSSSSSSESNQPAGVSLYQSLATSPFFALHSSSSFAWPAPPAASAAELGSSGSRATGPNRRRADATAPAAASTTRRAASSGRFGFDLPRAVVCRAWSWAQTVRVATNVAALSDGLALIGRPGGALEDVMRHVRHQWSIPAPAYAPHTVASPSDALAATTFCSCCRRLAAAAAAANGSDSSVADDASADAQCACIVSAAVSSDRRNGAAAAAVLSASAEDDWLQQRDLVQLDLTRSLHCQVHARQR
jgi:hypothetical protein